MDAPSFNGSDERDLSSGPPDPRATFRREFLRFHAKGQGLWFLEPYRLSEYFAADVEWAERELLTDPEDACVLVKKD